MKSATIRQVRHELGSVLDWVQAGETVAITRHGRPVAVLGPVAAPVAHAGHWPDFAARQRRIFGGRKLAGNSVLDDRESSGR